MIWARIAWLTLIRHFCNCTGYKNLVGARRASWRILQSVEQSEVAKGNEKRVKLIQKYRTVVEKELDDICGEILELLDKHLIPSASTCEASVFYLKMKADYLRYLSEFKVDADRKDAADKTLMAYNAAQDKALAELPSTNPIRLGLALNFSVFYYEVMNQPEKACNLAKQVRIVAVLIALCFGHNGAYDGCRHGSAWTCYCAWIMILVAAGTSSVTTYHVACCGRVCTGRGALTAAGPGGGGASCICCCCCQ
jgi:hypothetical protein